MQNRRKRSKTRINFWQDLMTFILFLAVIFTAFSDTVLHQWSGAGLVAAVFIHLGLHWRWFVATGRRFTKKLPHRIRLKLILNLAMLVVFLLLSCSGIIVALIYAPGVTTFHIVCFYLFGGLLALHLALNWKWIVSQLLHTISILSRQKKSILGKT